MAKSLFIWIAALMLLSPHAYGKIIHEDDHYFCGFDSNEEFLTWTKIDVNGIAQNGNSDWWWDARQKTAFISPSINYACDDWIISPAIHLTQGKSHVMKIYFKTSNSTKVEFTMGSDTTVEAQTIILQELTKYGANTYYYKYQIPADLSTGDYHFGVHVCSDAWAGNMNVCSFEVCEDNDGSIAVTVVDQADETVGLPNIQVSLTGETYESQTVNSDENGKATFENLTPGTYTITANNDNYYFYEDNALVVNNKEQVNYNLKLEVKCVTAVSGVVKGENGLPLPDASIVLKGGETYEAELQEDGSFQFPEVRQDTLPYVLTIQSDYRKIYRDENILALDKDSIDLGEIILTTFVNRPTNIKTSQIEIGRFVSWMSSINEKEFVWDNNIYKGIIKYYGFDYLTFGNRFEEPMLINSISWLFKTANETVDLYVYGLNQDGTINEKPLYEEKGVANPNLYHYEKNPIWNEHKLKEEVVAPYGCIIAVGHAGDAEMCCDYAKSYKSVSKINDGDFKGEPGTFFVRGKGATLMCATGKSPQKASYICYASNNQEINQEEFLTFKIWRMKVTDIKNEEAWTLLNDKSSISLYIDEDINNLEPGYYQYAVQASYADGNISDINFSEPFENKMHTSYTVYVGTNTAIYFGDGAQVILKNKTSECLEYTELTKDGIAFFANIEKGDYELSVSKEGFETYVSDVTVTDRGESVAALTLIKEKPFNVQVEQPENSTDIVLKWNVEDGIFEDFEEMEDFEVNPAGNNNWTYLDADGGKTYGVKLCEKTPYKNMFAPMAFMSFNPSMTEPNLLDFVQPHSGDKLLIDVSLENGEQNNDYMFSPKLSFENDFVMSFYAASGFFAASGKEKFMVGYCLDVPTPENIIWITEKPVEVGAVWTQFEYAIPKEALHTVIRCVSDQTLFFMLDDIYIGYKESPTFNMATFEVYIDEEFVAKTNKRCMNVQNLAEGMHIAKIQTVYVMADNTLQYSEEAEFVFEIKDQADGIGSEIEEALFNYDADSKKIVTKEEIAQLDLINMQGQICKTCTGNQIMLLEDYEQGVYIVKVKTTDNKISFHKIIIF